MPPYKINFTFFGTVGICLFNNEINIFNVTETIVSRETNAFAVRVSQRSERRHIENTSLLKTGPAKARGSQQRKRRTTYLKFRHTIIIPFIRDL